MKNKTAQKSFARRQKGAIAPLLIIGLLVIGIIVGIKLIGNPQIFKPKAGGGDGIDFTGPNISVNKYGVKTTQDVKVYLQVSSPFDSLNTPESGYGAQSVKEKTNDSRKRVLLPNFNQLLDIKPVFAQDTTSPVYNSKVLSGWMEVKPLPKGYYGGGAVTFGDYIFVGGGWKQSEPGLGESVDGSLYSARINEDGTLGEWKTDLTPLPPGSESRPGMVLYNGYIYLTGGENNSRATAEIYSAKIDYGGVIGSWNKVNTMPIDVARHSAVSANNYLYVLGRFTFDQPGARFPDVYFAKFTPTGGLEEWRPTTPLPKGLTSTAATTVSVDGTSYIFVAGGWGAEGGINSDIVYSVQVNNDGTLGEWKEVSKLSSGLSAATLTSDKGYLILAGGQVGLDSYTSQSSVYSAKIISGGSLGEWQKEDSLPSGVAFHSMVNTNLNGGNNNRSLYVLGGLNNQSVAQPNVYEARLLISDPSSPIPTPPPVPLSVRLVNCQSSDNGQASANIEWDPVKEATEYWIIVGYLSKGLQKYPEYPGPGPVQAITVPSSSTSYQLGVLPGDIHDVTVMAKVGKDEAVNANSEHIALVCGSEKTGTAAFRIADSRERLIRTPFQSYFGAFAMPYPLLYTRDTQYAFGEFSSFRNEVKAGTDSILYEGPIPTPPPLNKYPQIPIPSPVQSPSDKYSPSPTN